MSTPKGFGDRKHFEGDGCDSDSIRHSMYFQEKKLTDQVFGRKVPVMGRCMVWMYPSYKEAPYQCGNPVMEEEFDCGKHGNRK